MFHIQDRCSGCKAHSAEFTLPSGSAVLGARLACMWTREVSRRHQRTFIFSILQHLLIDHKERSQEPASSPLEFDDANHQTLCTNGSTNVRTFSCAAIPGSMIVFFLVFHTSQAYTRFFTQYLAYRGVEVCEQPLSLPH